ncbi:MAG: acyl-CoA dehydratase activase-related protein [Desulfotomaculaceae bacterium]|nr:acyl-CoA dehydratase activase-related protein [Desulfotomaculaceae bacterium]MDD4767290.1 acyl-CoA dehydratase activase-related protein [Desulfotomaculaceae bacterium]
MKKIVGIPSALMYYIYYPFWLAFFNEIGVEVVTSSRTTKTILDKGIREALADACVPIKLFFGHVMELKNKCDCLFIPRVVCLNGKTIYCPKFLGLPDMIRHSLDGIPPILDVRIDARQGRLSKIKAYLEIGSYFGANRKAVLKAYCKAWITLRRHKRLLRKGLNPLEAMELIKNPNRKKSILPAKSNLKFAVLGYPYSIYDNFINANLLDKLKKLGVSVLTTENINPLILALQKNCGLPKRLFWTFSDAILKAAHYLFRHRRVDAVLHLTAFGCGPDSLLNKFIEMEAKQHKDIPFMTLMIDEHTGEAGMATRLEAFVDMVRRRKEAYPCRN